MIQFAQMYATFVVSTKYEDKETPKEYLVKGEKICCSRFNQQNIFIKI
jgi:hypothetical protein